MPVLCVALAPGPDTMEPSPSIPGFHPFWLTSKSGKAQQCPCKYPFTWERLIPDRVLKFSFVWAVATGETKMHVNAKRTLIRFIFCKFQSDAIKNQALRVGSGPPEFKGRMMH
jgi:hypothetical protein